MKYLVIAKKGFKDIGMGLGTELDAAFESAVQTVCGYAVMKRIITDATDPSQKDKALAELKPHFEVRYIE